MELHGKVMITSKVVRPKTFNNQPVMDKDTNTQVIERYFQCIDLDSEHTDIYKVKFQPDQEKEVDANMRKTVMIVTTFGTYNKFPFYNLISIKAA